MKTEVKKKRLTPWDDGYYQKAERPGKPSQWKAAFSERMGWTKAVETIGADNAYDILGVLSTATAEQIKRAFRILIVKWHPDKWMNASPKAQRYATKKAKKIIAAYTVLMGRI